MRLKIKFQPEGEKFSLPCHYNELIQGFIYSHLDRWLAAKLHNKGIVDSLTKRKFKLFTFSRIIPLDRHYIRDGRLFFNNSASLIVASSMDDFIFSFSENLTKIGHFSLGNLTLVVTSVSIESPPEYNEVVKIRTLSPITIYTTFNTADGRKKTYYYCPFEKEFSEQIIQNLEKKYRALTNKKLCEGYIKPYKVSNSNERIVIYKGTVVKGWDGIFELSLPIETYKLAFDTGLGAKNSQGFGCIEIWKGGENK